MLAVSAPHGNVRAESSPARGGSCGAFQVAAPDLAGCATCSLHMKAWLATGAIILALFQLLTAARVFELLHFPPSGRVWGEPIASPDT